MFRRGSKVWRPRRAGLKGVGETECARSAESWDFEGRYLRVGCEGGNQRPTSSCLEVWLEALGKLQPQAALCTLCVWATSEGAVTLLAQSTSSRCFLPRWSSFSIK